MKLIKVAAAVLNQTPLDWNGNKARIIQTLEEARRQEVSIVCLPELCITGYGCEDAFQSPGVQKMAQRVLLELLPHTAGMIVSLGIPIFHGGGLFNSACLVSDGRLLGFVAKQNLAGDGIHYEPRWFKAWPNNVRTTTRIDGSEYPLGDLLFDCGDVRIGFEICEDAWVGMRGGVELDQQNVDIILNPSASHFAFGKHEIRQRFVLEGSRAFHVSYIYANLLGNEAGRAIYDGDAMIASLGRMQAAGPRFSMADHHLTTAVVDVDATRMSRARSATVRPQVAANEEGCRRVSFAFPDVKMPAAQSPSRSTWESTNYLKEEEFSRAVSLALYDYLRKSHSRGFVVSLSGGADSAAVSLLCALAVHFGVAELGRERFLDKLRYMAEVRAETDNRSLVRSLLTCVYQSTRNSGQVTLSAARSVAEAIGAEFLEFDIEPIVQQYVQVGTQAIGRPLNWEQDDLSLQNIQARARAPGVWLLANLRNALLLATSNRSEAAVGYTTMDGDTCGGLSPIAGIDKAFLRQWLNWMETQGPAGFGPIPELSAINRQQPTAELRPPQAVQTDEADLMPYTLLDAIERAAIRDKLTPLEAYRRLQPQFAQYSEQQLVAWVERFFQLWCRNQWKRERYAPSFHLDDENLDPKTWCRFPILSGNFERELAELRAAILFPAEAKEER